MELLGSRGRGQLVRVVGGCEGDVRDAVGLLNILFTRIFQWHIVHLRGRYLCKWITSIFAQYALT